MSALTLAPIVLIQIAVDAFVFAKNPFLLPNLFYDNFKDPRDEQSPQA